jgi:hypothetical protein
VKAREYILDAITAPFFSRCGSHGVEATFFLIYVVYMKKYFDCKKKISRY